jgi:hypothetical protein
MKLSVGRYFTQASLGCGECCIFIEIGELIDWVVFSLNKENIPSRAYIAFKNEEQLATFSQGYDGHLFRDKAGAFVFVVRRLCLSSNWHCFGGLIMSLVPGNESIAVVEFAPYQKIPTEKKKADARGGTIEKDEDYLSFLESLSNKNKPTSENGEPPNLESLSVYLLSSRIPSFPHTLPLHPLLQHLYDYSLTHTFICSCRNATRPPTKNHPTS